MKLHAIVYKRRDKDMTEGQICSDDELLKIYADTMSPLMRNSCCYHFDLEIPEGEI